LASAVSVSMHLKGKKRKNINDYIIVR